MTEIQAYFHSLFAYNPETGDLVWKKRTDSSRSSMVFNGRFVGKIAGSIVTSKNSKTSYLQTKTGNKTCKNHRIIFAMMTGFMPEEVDHIDHNGLNNRWDNLRASNKKDNSKNMPMQKSNKSGFIGVNWHKAAKKWQARAVNNNGIRIDLGRFDRIEDAIKARKDHEIEFGYYQHRGDV
ncbi:MAG: HNH endonuclease [Christensenellaceae bacterium]